MLREFSGVIKVLNIWLLSGSIDYEAPILRSRVHPGHLLIKDISDAQTEFSGDGEHRQTAGAHSHLHHGG